MRTAPPPLRSIARYSQLAPPNSYSGSANSTVFGRTQSRFPIRHPPCRSPSTRLSHVSPAPSSPRWLAEGPAAEAGDVPQEHQEPPALVNKFDWSFFLQNRSHNYDADPYGKWRSLSEDEERLKYEADILAPDTGYSRYVDWPKHEGDIELWSCILDYRARNDGIGGIDAVLHGLMRRQHILVVQGKTAERFWGKIVGAAVEDEEMLTNVWLYAEWLCNAHGLQLPNLYTIVLSSMIQRRMGTEALLWHIRLSPNFGLDTPGFAKLLRQFGTVRDKPTWTILQDLYFASGHRGLYDELIPYLFSEGHLQLARYWRTVLFRQNDGPTSLASIPFLRFHAAYFSDSPMMAGEVDIADQISSADVESDSLSPEIPVHRDGIRYFINKVHGQTFGIREKGYDDNLGARWFASSWVTVDSTIEMVRMLGFNSIGPLSLQSIALRERKADKIRRRIGQMVGARISVTDSSYTRALQHFANSGNQALLDSLLESDIHPDVFDDAATQRMILDSVLVTGNWEQHDLIMGVRFAVGQHLGAEVANMLLQVSLRQDRRSTALSILDAMSAGGAQLSEHTVDIITQHVLRSVSPHSWRDTSQKPVTWFQSAIFFRITPSQFPFPVEVLAIVLSRLGRTGLMIELERLSVQIMHRYHDIRHLNQGPWAYYHTLDLPPAIRLQDNPSKGLIKRNFQLLPHDLSLNHTMHPICRLFNQKMQSSIIRWGFRRGYRVNFKIDQPHVLELMEPKHFHFARGIRLLALLRDKGLAIQPLYVQKHVAIHIAELFWSGRLNALYGKELRKLGIRKVRERAYFMIREAVATCEEAWATFDARGNPTSPPPLLNLDRVIDQVKMWGLQWKKERRWVFATRQEVVPTKLRKMTEWQKSRWLARRGNGGVRWVVGHLPKNN